MWTPGYPTYCSGSIIDRMLIEIKIISTEHEKAEMLRIEYNQVRNPAIAFKLSCTYGYIAVL